MARIIIACRTLKRELEITMEQLGLSDPIIWLEGGDHNHPRKRREAIEAALGHCGDYDTVLLAMSFCGNALVGLDSGAHSLYLPCFDDCVGLLLDASRRSDTYYLTDGWLEGDRSILKEYHTALDKYGIQKTERIFSAMLRGYQYLAWVNTGCETPEGIQRAKLTASLLGLTFTEAQGSRTALEMLLRQEESSHILHLPPHTTITVDMRSGMLPVTVVNENRVLYALPGENLLQLLRRHGLSTDAPCGGKGTCGKCTVLVDGTAHQSCRFTVQSKLTLTLPETASLQIPTPEQSGCAASGSVYAAVDIGTTGVVSTLVGSKGEILRVTAQPNPQRLYGADVISRIQASLSGESEQLTRIIRKCVSDLLVSGCRDHGIRPKDIQRLCIVGNPAMQQLFLGISPKNLAQIPFSPLLTKSSVTECTSYLPEFSNTQLLTVPDISGYVGADTVGCILSEGLMDRTETTLLVDIGTNGEMVLSHNGHMIACATAAGPALEGANISCGMTASPGAIDHVWLEDGSIRFSTIGNVPASGICGSGLIDAIAALVELGFINKRGRIQTSTEKDGQRVVCLTEEIYLTQEDIRQVQMAKGAIRAGIELMVRTMAISMEEIAQCLLAGAFGTCLKDDSACRIGLLPPELAGKIRPVGNAALSGAIRIVTDPVLLDTADRIVRDTEYLELASMKDFPKAFARAMGF